MKKMLVFMVGACILLSSCINNKKNNNTDNIRLVPAENVSSIVFTDIDDKKEYTYTDAEWIGAFMSHFEGAINTYKESVQDIPLEDDLWMIDIKGKETVTTLFFYEENDRYFIEQPYQGIYEIGIDVEDIVEY